MTNFILSFGKFKGQSFANTPKWYQEWLVLQKWFKVPAESKSLHKKLHGWDGHSRKGQAVYDQIFQQEMDEADKYDPSDRYGHYEGIN